MQQPSRKHFREEKTRVRVKTYGVSREKDNEGRPAAFLHSIEYVETLRKSSNVWTRTRNCDITRMKNNSHIPFLLLAENQL